jgi:polyphenol oxidase
MKKIVDQNGLVTYRFDLLDAFSNLTHFMTTRHGGVSSGAFAAMNPSLTSGDDLQNVARNREILYRSIPIPSRRILAPHQIHKTNIRVVDEAFLQMDETSQRNALEGIDAMVTRLSDVCIAISTADCVPLLMYAPDQNVVAAVHAGWRGTVQKIAQRTIEFLSERYHCSPSLMRVGIGPSIGPDDFEVGEEVVDAFRDSGADMTQILHRTNKAHINLWEANRLQLLASGVPSEQIEVAGISTYSDCDEFFSARRLGIKCGRNMSAIMLKGKNHD